MIPRHSNTKSFKFRLISHRIIASALRVTVCRAEGCVDLRQIPLLSQVGDGGNSKKATRENILRSSAVFAVVEEIRTHLHTPKIHANQIASNPRLHVTEIIEIRYRRDKHRRPYAASSSNADLLMRCAHIGNVICAFR